MILRRVIAHFRKQEWTAIALDFLIVVVGVFVGLQVNNWNEARLAQAEEQRYLAQLLVEIEDAAGKQLAFLEQTQKRFDLMGEAIIAGQNPEISALTPEQCTELWSAHIQYLPSGDLTTIDEMIATSGLGLVSDGKLRSALIAYRSESQRRTKHTDIILDELVVNADAAPHAFQRSIKPDTLDDDVICDIEAIRQDQGLRNRLISNLGRISGLIWRTETEHKALLALAATVKDSAGRD